MHGALARNNLKYIYQPMIDGLKNQRVIDVGSFLLRCIKWRYGKP